MILTVTLNAAIDKLYVLDRLRPHEVMRVREVNSTAGGKGLNVSRVAALMGEQVTAMGFVGGYNGALFESLIHEKNIRKKFTRVQTETRCCINIRDLETNRSTELLEPGAPVTSNEIRRLLADFEAGLSTADVVTISGSMPNGTPADFYSVLIQAARQKKIPVLLDTSGDALQKALTARPFMMKPNTDEIRQLLQVDINSQRDLIEAAKRLHHSGVAVVAVSLGRDGVLVVCNEGVYHGVTPDIPVVNTVGCGDSMVAGFAVSMARRTTMEQAIRNAVAVSTANALTKETGFFRQKDFTELLEQVGVEQLERPVQQIET